MADDDVEIKMCEAGGGGGLLLPLFGGETEWPNGLRIVLYMVGLFWSFAGVAIVADVFMAAIEVITCQTKIIKVEGKEIRARIWNDTVANLSLMALGSSAPEILLSVIEIMGNKYYSGELGPSTIVGSAAFNLLVITAVCIAAIPDGDGRFVKDTNVFAVTASCSVFAYVWLLIILSWVSPNIVTMTEAILTFAFFPLLVAVAWAADRGMFSSSKARVGQDGTVRGQGRLVALENVAGDVRYDPKRVSIMINGVSKPQGGGGAGTPQEMTARHMADAIMAEQPKSRAQYRIAANKANFGGKRLGKVDKDRVVPVAEGGEEGKEANFDDGKAVVAFAAAHYICFENDQYVTAEVIREGPADGALSVGYFTRDGAGENPAKAGEDYVETNGTLHFKAGERMKPIKVKLIDDNQWEPDEDFDIVLEDFIVPASAGRLGEIASTNVTIVDDDEAGEIGFQKEKFTFKESVGKAQVVVLRTKGRSGKIGIRCATVDDEHEGSAMAGKDYVPRDEVLSFEHGETAKIFEVDILNDDCYEKDESFFVRLSEPTGGATIDPKSYGGDEFEQVELVIQNDDQVKSTAERVAQVLSVNADRFKVGSSSWKEQFNDALTCEGDDGEPPSGMDKFFHFSTLPWKLLFALIPPTTFGGGWVCFIIALVFIGGVTAIIGDLAALLGCCMGVPDAITAITFVALGTSLPDTFASKAAAIGEKHADASIGNVTGSNSVNVFLGLGLPWVIAAWYWEGQEKGVGTEWYAQYGEGGLNKATPPGGFPEGFVVPAGDLGFSVVVFSCCAMTCIGGLVARRVAFGYELGGPAGPKKASAAFFVCLWFVYILCSSLKTLGTI